MISFDLEACSSGTLNHTFKQQWHFHTVCWFEKSCLMLLRHTPPFPPCGEPGQGGNAAGHQKACGRQQKEYWPWLGFLTLQDPSGEKKRTYFSFLESDGVCSAWGWGMSCVLVGEGAEGWQTVGLGACSGATSILQVSWDPTVAGSNLLQCLWVMERRSLSSGANGDIVDSVQPGGGGGGGASMVAEEESKPGGKILACKGVRKDPRSCFDVISSASSSSSKSGLCK